MQITATQLKQNIGKYLALSTFQDVYITKNGKSISKLTNVKTDKLAILESLIGILPDDGTSLDGIRTERLDRQ